MVNNNVNNDPLVRLYSDLWNEYSAAAKSIDSLKWTTDKEKEIIKKFNAEFFPEGEVLSPKTMEKFKAYTEELLKENPSREIADILKSRFAVLNPINQAVKALTHIDLPNVLNYVQSTDFALPQKDIKELMKDLSNFNDNSILDISNIKLTPTPDGHKTNYEAKFNDGSVVNIGTYFNPNKKTANKTFEIQ